MLVVDDDDGSRRLMMVFYLRGKGMTKGEVKPLMSFIRRSMGDIKPLML
jgi:hypothetical protein